MLLALIKPNHWTSSVFMCCQEPLNIGTGEFHPFERIDSLCNIRDDCTMLAQFFLTICINFRFSSPPQKAFCSPICTSFFRRCRRGLQWSTNNLLCLLAVEHHAKELANRVHRGFSPLLLLLVFNSQQTSRRSSRTFGSRKMAGCARYRPICFCVSATCSA